MDQWELFVQRRKWTQLCRSGGYAALCVTTIVAVGWVVYSVTANLYLAWWTVLVLMVWAVLFSPDLDLLIRWSLRRLGASDSADGSPISPTRHYPAATIAFDLVPCLKHFLSDSCTSESCTLVITGNDCYTLTLREEDYPWKGFLTQILENDQCRVIQYVSHGKHTADSILQKLQEEYPDRFEYRRLANPELVSDPVDQELLKALHTFHPTLAWKDSGGKDDEKMMWIERYHPSGSKEASSCDYYDAQTLLRNSQGFDFFRDRLDTAWAITQNIACLESQTRSDAHPRE